MGKNSNDNSNSRRRNVSPLGLALQAVEATAASRFVRPSEETIWAYLAADATDTQREEMHAALALSADFRDEMFDMRDDLEFVTSEQAQQEVESIKAPDMPKEIQKMLEGATSEAKELAVAPRPKWSRIWRVSAAVLLGLVSLTAVFQSAEYYWSIVPPLRFWIDPLTILKAALVFFIAVGSLLFTRLLWPRPRPRAFWRMSLSTMGIVVSSIAIVISVKGYLTYNRPLAQYQVSTYRGLDHVGKMKSGDFVSRRTRSTDEQESYVPLPLPSAREAAELAFSRAITKTNGDYRFMQHDRPRNIELSEAPLRRLLQEDTYVFGYESQTVSLRLTQLGLYLMHEGRHEEADSLLHDALRINRQFLDPGDLTIAENLDDLADLHMRLEEYSPAESLYVDALEIRQQASAPGTPELVNSYNRLSRLITERGYPNKDLYPENITVASLVLVDAKRQKQKEIFAVIPHTENMPSAWALSIPKLDLHELKQALYRRWVTALWTKTIGDRGAITFTYETEDGFLATEPVPFDFRD